MEDLYTVTDPYGTYQTKGEEDPYDILLRMKSWQNEIRATISKVTDNVTTIHEQQTQILQDIDSIDLSVLDILTDLTGKTTQISQLLLEVGQVKINVSDVDTRLGTAEGTLVVQAGLIGSKVSLTDFTGQTIASMIVQDPYSISLFAQYLNLTGYVTFNALANPGQTIINGSNITTGQILANLIYGQVFVVGNGTSTELVLTSIAGSHSMQSYDANGYRIGSTGTLSFQAGPGWTVYSNSKFWARVGLEVSGYGQFNNDVSVAGQLSAGSIVVNGSGVVNVNTVQTMINNATANLVTVSYLNSALAQKETEIVAWANAKFVAK